LGLVAALPCEGHRHLPIRARRRSQPTEEEGGSGTLRPAEWHRQGADDGEGNPEPWAPVPRGEATHTSIRTGGASRHDTRVATTTSTQGNGAARFFLSLSAFSVMVGLPGLYRRTGTGQRSADCSTCG
jgi:hypothetical protein